MWVKITSGGLAVSTSIENHQWKRTKSCYAGINNSEYYPRLSYKKILENLGL